MPFDNSPIRAFHDFRRTFVYFMHRSRITRQQVVFLSYLIENGHIKDFQVRSVRTKGLSWELANQYLNSLKKIGYTIRKGHRWTITNTGRDYYTMFLKEFNRTHQGAFFWK